jgi:hypothetical protein
MTPPWLEMVESNPPVGGRKLCALIHQERDLTSADAGGRLDDGEEDVTGKDLRNHVRQYWSGESEVSY